MKVTVGLCSRSVGARPWKNVIYVPYMWRICSIYVPYMNADSHICGIYEGNLFIYAAYMTGMVSHICLDEIAAAIYMR